MSFNVEVTEESCNVLAYQLTVCNGTFISRCLLNVTPEGD